MFQAARLLLEKLKSDRVIVAKRLELLPDLNSTDASAISVETPVTVLTCAGSETRTLANGYPGQVKIIFLMTDGGSVVLTPAYLYNGDTITFGEVNDSWWGIFYAGQWHTIAGTAAVTVLG